MLKVDTLDTKLLQTSGIFEKSIFFKLLLSIKTNRFPDDLDLSFQNWYRRNLPHYIHNTHTLSACSDFSLRLPPIIIHETRIMQWKKIGTGVNIISAYRVDSNEKNSRYLFVDARYRCRKTVNNETIARGREKKDTDTKSDWIISFFSHLFQCSLIGVWAIIALNAKWTVNVYDRKGHFGTTI